MAAHCTFKHNPVLISMVINTNNLEIKFKKYTKKYFGVEQSVAYGLFYSEEPLKYFNQNIKNKMKTIKNFSNYKANTATGEVINAKTGKSANN